MQFNSTLQRYLSASQIESHVVHEKTNGKKHWLSQCDEYSKWKILLNLSNKNKTDIDTGCSAKATITFRRIYFLNTLWLLLQIKLRAETVFIFKLKTNLKEWRPHQISYYYFVFHFIFGLKFSRDMFVHWYCGRKGTDPYWYKCVFNSSKIHSLPYFWWAEAIK